VCWNEVGRVDAACQRGDWDWVETWSKKAGQQCWMRKKSLGAVTHWIRYCHSVTCRVQVYKYVLSRLGGHATRLMRPSASPRPTPTDAWKCCRSIVMEHRNTAVTSSPRTTRRVGVRDAINACLCSSLRRESLPVDADLGGELIDGVSTETMMFG
jgi:hypothetical protein